MDYLHVLRRDGVHLSLPHEPVLGGVVVLISAVPFEVVVGLLGQGEKHHQQKWGQVGEEET